MRIRGYTPLLAALVAVLLSGREAPAFQAQATIRFNPERPLAAIPRSDAEQDAFASIGDERDENRRLRLISDFLGDFSDSEFQHLVLRARWQVVANRGEPEEIIEAAEDALNAEDFFWNTKTGFISDPSSVPAYNSILYDFTNQKALYYGSMADAYTELGDSENALMTSEAGLAAVEESWEVFAGDNPVGTPDFETARQARDQMRSNFLEMIVPVYQATGDTDKVVEYGRRLLEVAPDNLEMLMTVSSLMAQRPPEDQSLMEEHLAAAEGYAVRAVEEMDGFLAGAGAQLDAERQDGLRSGVHSTLGIVYLQQGEIADAIEQYEAALEATPADAVSNYMLGVAYYNTQDVDGAVASLARAVALGINQPQAQTMLEAAYQVKNGSLDGLDAYIQSEGEKVRN